MAEPVNYDEHTALLVVDVQNDFADPAGSLYVAGGEEVPSVANREAFRARAAGALVAYTRDWHPPENRRAASGRCTACARPGGRSSIPR